MAGNFPFSYGMTRALAFLELETGISQSLTLSLFLAYIWTDCAGRVSITYTL